MHAFCGPKVQTSRNQNRLSVRRSSRILKHYTVPKRLLRLLRRRPLILFQTLDFSSRRRRPAAGTPAARGSRGPRTWGIWARGERANVTRLVLGCIEAKFCKEILVGKLSPRSTQCTPLHRSRISIFSLTIAEFFADSFSGADG